MTHVKITYDVFLSYNNRDQTAVEDVARRLREQGLTVFLDRWYLVAGTPWPQQLETILAGCRSAVIFLSSYGMGRWQQREQYLALDRQAKNSGFPVIPVLLPGSDPALGFLSLNTWIDLRQGVDSPDSILSLAEAIQGRPPGPDSRRRTATALSSICPYRGLRFFREEDAPFFFGRDAFIERLTGAVSEHSLVAVVGASGSGKSSVVRAGLIPRLRQGTSGQVWDVVTILPGDRPLQSLAAAMVRLLEPEMSEIDRLREVGKLAESFADGSVKLRDVVSRAIEKQTGTDRLMLVVDQWEELYTLTRDQHSQQLFLDELLDATASSPLSVVLTLRGDFFEHVLSYRPFSDRLQGAIVNVSRMTREELTQVIESPAQKVGMRFESGLVNRILDKVEGQPGNLPLLEFVLTELWKERQEEMFTHLAYEKIGEIQGAIATHAETVFASFSTSDQEIARRVFLQLVRMAADDGNVSHEADTEPTRRRTSFAEFGSESLPVVRKLADAHLIVTGRNEATGEEFIDLVHEALIKAWDRLRKWIDDDRVFLAWRERLRMLTGISAAGQFHKSTLLRGKILAEARGWLEKRGPDLSPAELRYVNASISGARSELMWRVGIAAGIGVLIALIVVFGFLLYKPGPTDLTEKTDPSPTATATPEETPEDSGHRLSSLTKDQAELNLGKVRTLLGVTSLDMNGSPTIAVVGPAPPEGTLPADQMKTVDPTGGSSHDVDSEMSEYVSSLVQCVRVTAPKTKFVFIHARLDSNFESDFSAAMKLLIASEDKPRILLAPYRLENMRAFASALRTVTTQGILVILSGGNEPSNSQSSERIDFREQFVVLGSVNLAGQRSRFSAQYEWLLWATGEDLPVRRKDVLETFTGTGPAAAVATGVAVRILDRYPDLTPAQVIEVMRSTSKAKTANGPPIINLEAAFTRLSSGR